MRNDDKKITENICHLQADKKFFQETLNFGITQLDWMHWIKGAMREVCTFQNQALTWALKPLSSSLTYKKLRLLGFTGYTQF